MVHGAKRVVLIQDYERIPACTHGCGSASVAMINSWFASGHLIYPRDGALILLERMVKNRAGKIGAENIKAWHQALEYQVLRILTISLPPNPQKWFN